MPFWAAAAATVVGAAAQSDSARRSSNTQADAAREANEQQWRMYEQNRQDQMPWQQAGRSALSQLQGLGNPQFQGGYAGSYEDVSRDFGAGDFQQDPGYRFRMQQGQEAIENSASARGGLGGDTLRALAEYGQNFASNEYQNAYNRFQQNRNSRAGAYQDSYGRWNNERNTRYNQLSNLAGLGQTANNQIGNMGSNAANMSGQLMMGGANARAAGQMGQSNAWTGAANNIGNLAMQWRASQPQSAPQSTPSWVQYDTQAPNSTGPY